VSSVFAIVLFPGPLVKTCYPDHRNLQFATGGGPFATDVLRGQLDSDCGQQTLRCHGLEETIK